MRLFRTVLILTAAVLLLNAGQARAASFPLSGENTKIEFTGKKKDGAHTGEFKKVSGTAKAEGTDPTTLAIDVTIDVDSMVTDDPKLTAHLKAPDFFDLKKHPTAKFVTTSVAKEKDGYVVKGKLTLLGKTNDVSFPADITVTGDGLKLASKFNIDRTAWGMTYGKGMVNDEVEMKITIATK